MVKMMELDKNFMGSIVIIISLSLLFLCIGQLICSFDDSFDESVNWNGLNYILPPNSEYNMTNDSLIITSSIDEYNIELFRTNDLIEYNKYIAKNITNCVSYSFNSTHTLLINEKNCYAAIIPTESIKDNPSSNPYTIQDNSEIIEVKAKNAKYIESFLNSAYNG